MAALPIGSSSFQSTTLKNARNCPKTTVINLSFHSQEPFNTCSQTGKNQEKEKKPMRSKFLVDLNKFGKGLKDNLNLQPKQKGDWKDLVLMSLSFAVYVYISQKLVCAYFAWVNMPKTHW